MVYIKAIFVYPKEGQFLSPLCSKKDLNTEVKEEELESFRERLTKEYYEQLNEPVKVRFLLETV